MLISKPEGEDSRALGQLVEAFSPLLGSEAPGKGQCPEPLEWLRFLTFWERPARGSEAVGVTQPGFSFSSRSRSGLTLRKNFLKMFAVRANLRPSSRGWPLPPLGSPASPVSPFSPPFSSSGKSSQLPTRSAKTLSPNTRGCRFRPRDINVEVQSSGSASSGPCWAQVWGSGSGVLGGVASSLPHTLLGDGNLALLVLPREAWLEGEQDPSHRGGSSCVRGLSGEPGAGPPPEISSCSRAVCTCRSFSSCSAPIIQFIWSCKPSPTSFMDICRGESTGPVSQGKGGSPDRHLQGHSSLPLTPPLSGLGSADQDCERRGFNTDMARLRK